MPFYPDVNGIELGRLVCTRNAECRGTNWPGTEKVCVEAFECAEALWCVSYLPTQIPDVVFDMFNVLQRVGRRARELSAVERGRPYRPFQSPEFPYIIARAKVFYDPPSSL